MYCTSLFSKFAVKNQELYTVMDVSHNNSDRGTPLLCFQPVTSLDYGLMATLPSPSPMRGREEPFLSEFIVKYATEPRSRPSENRLTSHTVFTVLESGYRAVEECAVMTDLVPDFKRLRGLLGGSTGVPEF